MPTSPLPAALKVLPPDTLVTGVTALRRYSVAVGSSAPLQFVTAHPHHVRRSQCAVTRVGALPPRDPRQSRARRAARLVRERLDSPLETALRLCLVLAGLPEPECNVVLGDATHLIGRVDLRLAAYAIILEYEGDQHRTDTGQWHLDITRQEEFGAAGFCLIRVTAQRMRQPHQVVLGVHRALRAAGYAGPEPVFSPEWLALFTSAR